jgi:hypothetical protein
MHLSSWPHEMQAANLNPNQNHENFRTPELQNFRTAELQNRRTAEPQNRRTAELQNCRII